MIFVDNDDDYVNHEDVLMRMLMTVVKMMILMIILIFQEVFNRLSQITGLEQGPPEVMLIHISWFFLTELSATGAKRGVWSLPVKIAPSRRSISRPCWPKACQGLVMMIMIMIMMIIAPADPGCQEEEDMGRRYAGTATVTVTGRSLQGIDKRVYKRIYKRMDKWINKRMIKRIDRIVYDRIDKKNLNKSLVFADHSTCAMCMCWWWSKKCVRADSICSGSKVSCFYSHFKKF